jgi:radical SAM superfamily enzyme
MKVTINIRKDQLKAMHEVILNANNENIYMSWIITVPDCPQDDDFEWIAEDDDRYNEVCDLFIQLVSKKSYRC